MVQFWVGSGWVTGQPVFASGQRNRVRVGYFSGRVGLSQKILTCFAMSTIRPIDINSFYAAMAYGAQRAGKIPQIHGSCLM